MGTILGWGGGMAGPGNAEYDYTIRDLTGVDMKPTREFPVDPANQAGFDNSGESLISSPRPAEEVSAGSDAKWRTAWCFHTPDGFDFAPYPMLVETDREKYAIQRIVNFYFSQPTDYADYFEAAWQFKISLCPQHSPALQWPRSPRMRR